jgi:glycosyltransferase involved in cell wall biosynthesis
LVLRSYDDRDPTYENEIQELVVSLGLEHVVRWLDEMPHVRMPEIYAAADIVINFPSMDAFPVSLIEAAACGCRVITCALPAYRQTFVEKCFSLVEAGKAHELADAIISAVNAPSNPGAEADTVAEARKIVEREYDAAVCIRRLLAIYRTLAK